MAVRIPSRERTGRDRPRLASWLLGYPSTVLLGAAYATAIGVRWSVAGAAAFFVLVVAVAAGERWGERAAGADAREWPAFRLAYSAFVIVGTIVFAVTTGAEFYFFALPAVALTPAVSSIGKGLRARSTERAARPAA